MKRIGICLLGVMTLFITNNVFGQITNQDDLQNGLSLNPEIKQSKPPLNYQKLHLSLDVGAGFMGSKYNSGVFTTIAPNLNYMVTPKLKLEAGVVFVTGNHNFYQMPVGETQQSVFQRTNQVSVYTQGEYLLTDRLTLTGAFYKTFTPGGTSQINPYALNYNDMYMGLDYKLTKNIKLGAAIRYTNGNSFVNPRGIGLYSPNKVDIFGNPVRYSDF